MTRRHHPSPPVRPIAPPWRRAAAALPRCHPPSIIATRLSTTRITLDNAGLAYGAMPSIQKTSSPVPFLVLIRLVRPSLSLPVGGVGCLHKSLLLLTHACTARPVSPSQKRKTPGGDLANSDSSVVSSFRPGFHFTDTHPYPLSHVRPSTPHASPPAPH
jgi:hypothetical protein